MLLFTVIAFRVWWENGWSAVLFFTRICEKSEEITKMVRGTPKTTEEIVTELEDSRASLNKQKTD